MNLPFWHASKPVKHNAPGDVCMHVSVGICGCVRMCIEKDTQTESSCYVSLRVCGLVSQ